MKVRWTTPALQDLEGIGDHIGRHNPAAACRIVGAILDKSAALQNTPYQGRPGRVLDTRELVITGTHFIVPYRIQSGCIDLLAVIHSSRRWPDVFD